MTPAPPDPSPPAQLREFHAKLPLAGGRPNALFPAGQILSLAAVLRDTPQQPPALSLEAWREFIALLRPPAEVTDTPQDEYYKMTSLPGSSRPSSVRSKW